MKDPYIFDFLSIRREVHEREVEKTLVHHMEKFILELGSGFTLVGRQYHFQVGGQDFYIDLLFYHLKLRCFVVVELKDKDFKPEYARQAEYTLRGTAKPIGLAEYQLTERFPEKLKTVLPTIEELEAALTKDLEK